MNLAAVIAQADTDSQRIPPLSQAQADYTAALLASIQHPKATAA